MSSSILAGLDDSISLDSQSLNDMLLAKSTADALDRAYPGHLWAVDVNGGVLNIRNLLLSPDMGWRLRVPSIYSASEFNKRVLHAGGDILERFHLARGRLREGQYAGLKTRFDGTPEYDR
jgi:hypothetical protein